jgi:hypothetical protein
MGGSGAFSIARSQPNLVIMLGRFRREECEFRRRFNKQRFNSRGAGHETGWKTQVKDVA